MELIGFLPSIISGIVAISLFYNAEREDEYIGKIWSLILGILFVWATIFLLNLSIGYSSAYKTYDSKEEIEEYHIY